MYKRQDLRGVLYYLALLGISVLLAAASVFLRPGAAAGGVLRGLSVCYETVIPALFPFLVLSRLLLESRAANALGLLLRPYTRLLGLHSTKAPAAMLCGVLGGDVYKRQVLSVTVLPPVLGPVMTIVS